MAFNPFNKSIEDITGDDLLNLKMRQVCEGWFIDYKSSIPDDIGRHFCAFSNTNGGWIIFGAREDSKKKYIESFPGLNISDMETALSKLTIAAASQVHPSVSYREKIIQGPILGLGLSDDRFVLIVEIQEGRIPPYIFQNGGIYARVNDESKPLKDRNDIDQLYQKAKAADENLSNFLRSSIDPPSDPLLPYITIHFITDPFLRKWTELSFTDFKQICSGADKEMSTGVYSPMDNFFSSRGGFTARQVKNNTASERLFSFQWWNGGNFKITIPINCVSDPLQIKDKFSQEFRALVTSKKDPNLKIANLNKVAIATLSGYRVFKRFLSIVNNSDPIYWTATIENFIKITPFISEEKFIENIKVNDLPVIHEKLIHLPRNIKIINLSLLKEHAQDSENPASYASTIELAPLFFVIFGCLGVTTSIEDLTSMPTLFGSTGHH